VKCHRRRSCSYRITMNSRASGLYYTILHKTITSSRIRYSRPKHVVVSIIVIKYTSVIKLCLTTYLFLVSHTYNGDDTLPRLPRIKYTTRSEYCGNRLLCVFTVMSCCISMRLYSWNMVHTPRLEVCRHVVGQIKSYILQMVLSPCYALLAWSEGRNKITYLNVFSLFHPRRFCRSDTWMS